MQPRSAASAPGRSWTGPSPCATRVIAAATSRGLRVSVAVVDRGGDPVQQDRMDDGSGRRGRRGARDGLGGRAGSGCRSGELSRDVRRRRSCPGGPVPVAVPRRRRVECRSSSTAGSSAASVSAAPTRSTARTLAAEGRAHDRRPPVRVAVLGCGAIGSLYAAHLARVPGRRGVGRRPVGGAHRGDRRATGCG